MHSPYTVRRIDASHVLLSDGWVVGDVSWQPPLLSCPLAASITTTSMTPQSPPFLPHEKGSKFRSENVKAHVKPTTRKPQDCPPLSRKPPHRRPLFGARLGKRLAQTRWNSFVGSPGSRLAKIMLPRMGKRLWDEFISHATQHYWEKYLRVFMPPSLVLACSGKLDGSPCPHAFRIDLCSPDARATTGCLHLDHERKVRETCRAWLENLPIKPETWHDGSSRDDLCHALFGVSDGENTCCVRFRCSARNKAVSCENSEKCDEWLSVPYRTRYAEHTFILRMPYASHTE